MAKRKREHDSSTTETGTKTKVVVQQPRATIDPDCLDWGTLRSHYYGEEVDPSKLSPFIEMELCDSIYCTDAGIEALALRGLIPLP